MEAVQNQTRFPIGTIFNKKGSYFGEIISYAADKGKTDDPDDREYYLMNSWGRLILTNRATLDFPENGFEIVNV